MSPQEVKEIASEIYWEHNKEIVNGLIQLNQKMNTKQVCAFLGCERHWLSKNRHLFNGKVINKRGVLQFEAAKVVAYKRDQLQ